MVSDLLEVEKTSPGYLEGLFSLRLNKISITLDKNCKSGDCTGFPIMAAWKLFMTYLVVCWIRTLFSPSHVLFTSLLLYNAPILLYAENPCPPIIWRLSRIASVAVQAVFAFSTDDTAWIYWINGFVGDRIFLSWFS
jgi:hypothetical protein